MYFDDTIKQDVAAMGFDLSEPVKTGDSGKYTAFRCRSCATTRRREQFWGHFFGARHDHRCAAKKDGDERECTFLHLLKTCG